MQDHPAEFPPDNASQAPAVLPRIRFPDGRPEADQPGWRHAFPIDWGRDQVVSRRDFTRLMVLTGLAFTVAQFGVGLASLRAGRARPEPKALARVEEIPVGETMRLHYPGPRDPILLTHLSTGAFVAYGQLCTHLQCPVVPRAELGRLECPCHNGWFDLAEGRPMAGPPRRPLTRIQLEIRDGVIHATGVEERTA